MKKLTFSFAITLMVILFLVSSFSGERTIMNTDEILQDTSRIFKDGSYEGKSRSIYTDEPFWGIIRITIKDGSFSAVNFMVRDSNLHETFSENYEKHYEGNQVYIEQCRNDWKGIQTYPKLLFETQNHNKIDAISGATWSYDIFKASLGEALKNAEESSKK